MSFGVAATTDLKNAEDPAACAPTRRCIGRRTSGRNRVKGRGSWATAVIARAAGSALAAPGIDINVSALIDQAGGTSST